MLIDEKMRKFALLKAQIYLTTYELQLLGLETKAETRDQGSLDLRAAWQQAYTAFLQAADEADEHNARNRMREFNQLMGN